MSRKKHAGKIVQHRPRRVLAFGAFDGIHPGHIHFLRQARAMGEVLIVAVARDSAIISLKKNPPRFSLAKRMRALRSSGLADKIVPGDARRGSWNIIKKEKPDIIALGYDQKEMARDLRAKRASFARPFRLASMKAHRPRVFHSRILNREHGT